MICVCLQNLRSLENSLEKTQFKCKEAEIIMINYMKLKSHLQVSPPGMFMVFRLKIMKTLLAEVYVGTVSYNYKIPIVLICPFYMQFV